MMTVPAGMKPFNLEAAKTGAPCVTRDGRKVVFVSDHYDVKVPEMLVEFCYADLSSANIRVDERGRFYGGLYASPKDVFLLAPEPQVGPLGPEPPVNQKLAELLEKARHYPMSPAEKWDQHVSFVYGNVAMHNPEITRELVEAAATELYGPRPEEPPAKPYAQFSPEELRRIQQATLAKAPPAPPPAKPKAIQMVLNSADDLIVLYDDNSFWKLEYRGWRRIPPGE